MRVGCINPEPLPPRARDLTGEMHGRLTVTGFAGRDHRGKLCWQCRCACGGETAVRYDQLVSGHTRSCGCLSSEKTAARTRTHGMSRARGPEYVAWSNMMQRCTNPRYKWWKNYGGRGIAVCERWRLFENFYADMGERPGKGYSIERKDNDLGYFPGNCVWATPKEQLRNTRRNQFITFQGLTLCREDWAIRQGLSREAIRKRLQLGWSVERALTEPIQTDCYPTINLRAKQVRGAV